MSAAVDEDTRARVVAFLTSQDAWSAGWRDCLDKINPDSDYWESDERTAAELAVAPHDYSQYDESRADMGEEADDRLDRAVELLRALIGTDDTAPRTCLLTGASGENADDCTTHDHDGED